MMNFASLACATCQINSAATGNAAGYAILFMLVVVLPVLVGIVFMIARMAKREHDSLDPSLRDNFEAKQFIHPSH